MRIAFAGTPDFAAAALRALVEAGHDVALVLTQPDRPAGRGLKLQPSAVKSLAHEHGLLLIQPRGLRLDGKYADEAEAARLALQAAAPELMVVAAYGLILPQWVLSVPPRGCLNIHASLLPRWRGAAPIHRAIEAGDAQTGITIMQMDAGLDTGDMLWVERWPIAADDTTGSLQAKLAELGARTIVDALAAPYLSRTPQPAEGVTYAHKIDKREAAIDWRASAAVLERRLRAFDPFPGAHFSLGGETVKLWRAVVCADAAPGAEPGQVIQAGASTLRVACGEGALGLLTLQCPGGRRIDSAAFLRGRALQAGDRLG